MLDLIWFTLIFGSVILSVLRGEPAAVTLALLEESEAAVKLTLSLIGNMAFWLGILNIAEESGLVTMLSQLFKPIFTFLFPTVPATDPATGSILLNLSANMLGLGNAATPLGLKAMQRLQELNPNPDEATPAMCTFLALNTCCITFIPTSILAVRVAVGSTKPAATVGVTFISTVVASLAAIIADRVCQQIWGRD